MARPKKTEGTTRVTIGASVLPGIEHRITLISISEDRSASQVIEKLLLRGLAAYERDGQLQEIQDIEIAETDAVEFLKKKKKVIKR